MGEHDHLEAKAARRFIISQRLKEFYADLCETLDGDTEEFFDRVMRQQRNDTEHGRPGAAR
jgi:hypothetical protein